MCIRDRSISAVGGSRSISLSHDSENRTTGSRGDPKELKGDVASAAAGTRSGWRDSQGLDAMPSRDCRAVAEVSDLLIDGRASPSRTGEASIEGGLQAGNRKRGLHRPAARRGEPPARAIGGGGRDSLPAHRGSLSRAE